MRKLIVLDTNILIRAILAERVPNLLDKYHYNCSFAEVLNVRKRLKKSTII
jgi:predicted nucleic acid-binding protein